MSCTILNLPKVSPDAVVVLGDNAALHNRIRGRDDFHIVVEGVRQHPRETALVEIGLSRYNFFRLGQIYKFCLELMDIDASRYGGLAERFSIWPLADMPHNLSQVVGELNKIDRRVQVKLYDEGLPEILEKIELGGMLYQDRENDLVRLLGVICEEAFIGPQVIVVDPFHRCNIKCAHCFVHNPLINHDEEFLDTRMSLQTFRDIADDAAELKTDCIILQGDGEPLLHPDFLSMIAHVKSRGMKALFFTNGTLLSREMAEQIVDLEVSEIYCSLPAGSAETYAAVCLGTKRSDLFDRTVHNMKTLMDIKRTKGRQYPTLIMTHVMHKMNFHELVPMAEMDAFIRADATRFYMIRIDENNKHLQLNDEQLAAMKGDLPAAESILRRAGIRFISNIKFQFEHYDKSTGAWSKDVFLNEGCTIGWHFCLIPARGDISMCCHLRTVGYLQNARLKDIWHSDYYRQKRIQAKFMSDNMRVTCLNGVRLYDEHCDHCDNHQNLLNTVNGLKELGLYKFLKS